MILRRLALAWLGACALLGPGCKSSGRLAKEAKTPVHPDCQSPANGIRFLPFAGKVEKSRSLPAEYAAFHADSAEAALLASRFRDADTIMLALPLATGCEAFLVWNIVAAPTEQQPGYVRLSGRGMADTGAVLKLTIRQGQMRGTASAGGKSLMLNPAAGPNGERLLVVSERQHTGAAPAPVQPGNGAPRQPFQKKTTASPAVIR